MNGVLALIAALLLALMVCGCAAGGGAGGSEAAVTTVILVRHAEKESGPDPALTAAGRVRAEALVGEVRATLPAGAGLDAALATNTRRAQETAAPAAGAFGIEVTTTPLSGGADGYFADVVRRIRGELAGKRVLVVGHSNTTPQMVELLTGASGLMMSEAEYDRLFVVRLFADGRSEWEERRYGAR